MDRVERSAAILRNAWHTAGRIGRRPRQRQRFSCNVAGRDIGERQVATTETTVLLLGESSRSVSDVRESVALEISDGEVAQHRTRTAPFDFSKLDAQLAGCIGRCRDRVHPRAIRAVL